MSYFGTDGIRGKFGELPITPEFALKLGFAAGKVLKQISPKTKPIVVLGKDTRLSLSLIHILQAGDTQCAKARQAHNLIPLIDIDVMTPSNDEDFDQVC